MKQAAADEQLLRWRDDKTNAFTHTALDGDNVRRAVGASAIPSAPHITKIHMSFPSSKRAKDIADALGDPKSGSMPDALPVSEGYRASVHADLRASFWMRSGMIDEPPLGVVPASAHTTSVCRRLGICLCRRPELSLFRNAFLGLLKPWYRKHKDNQLKAVLEDAFGVVRIEWWDIPIVRDVPYCARKPAVTWYHIALANQRNWDVALTELVPERNHELVSAAEGRGNIALSVRAIELDEIVTGDPFEKMGINIVPKIFLTSPLTHVARSTLFTLVENDTPLPYFTAGNVEVQQLGEPQMFWPGAAEALRLANERRRRATASNSDKPKFGDEHMPPVPDGEVHPAPPADPIPIDDVHDDLGADIEDEGGDEWASALFAIAAAMEPDPPSDDEVLRKRELSMRIQRFEIEAIRHTNIERSRELELCRVCIAITVVLHATGA